MKELTYKQKELLSSLINDRNAYKDWLAGKINTNDQFASEVRGCLAWAEEDLKVKGDYDRKGIYFLLNALSFLKEQTFIFSDELILAINEANEFIDKQEIKAYE